MDSGLRIAPLENRSGLLGPAGVRLSNTTRILFRWGLILLLWRWEGASLSAARVDYNREIRPLMADTCFRCHGFDAAARKAGLRLDVRAEALKPAKSGALPILPGKPEESEVIRRLFAASPDDLMPPPESHRELTVTQRELFRRWIAEGAEYAGHWAFEPPVRLRLPETSNPESGTRNPIDAWVMAKLAERGWQPAREAERTTLIRRVTLDLTGLPPAPEEVDAFLADRSSGAWDRLVERLLASPHYGERMAQDWLDAARFADSNGYQVDRDREMWAWRDWVVNAFNRNQPFDQFTVEQFAGDLLPDATVEQRIATGFHRNHMINEEGGIIPEEFLNEYCADRVETMATVWLGLSFNCARCHDHKYDPITQRDFYSLYAFFHNVAEKGVGDYGAPYRRSSPPWLKLPSPELDGKIARLNRELEVETIALQGLATAWESRAREFQPEWRMARDFRILEQPAASDGDPVKAPLRTVAGTGRRGPQPVTALQLRFSRKTAQGGEGSLRVAVHEIRVFRSNAPGPSSNTVALRARPLVGSVAVEPLALALDKKGDTAWSVGLTNDAVVVATVDLTPALTGEPGTAWRLEMDLGVAVGRGVGSVLDDWQLEVWETDTPLELLLPPEVSTILAQAPADRSEGARKRIEEFRLAQSPAQAEKNRRLGELRKQITDTDNAWPVTLVMAEMEKPRETFVLKRGAYDQRGDAVGANTPASLLPFPAGLPRNRLGLARWLVDPANPLPARVIVNRLWQSFFGTGLVRTAEDFGVQGEWPSHPELLDWLATEFIRSGWDVKAMVRRIVTSATYRQDSRTTPELRILDPENRWLARGPRYRLSAEAIRDQALAASGLFVDQLGGPSVKPYHPPGLYEQVVAGSSADTYVMDHGQNLYRRTLYTYWKRSVPNPALLLFDRPFRESCAVRRSRTSTPLQALNLLNDPTYVEAARALAQRMMREGGATLESRIRHGFRCLTARAPRPSELAVLTAGWRRAESGFRQDPARAAEWLQVGESKPDGQFEPVELAAYATVASTILNLDEVITKE